MNISKALYIKLGEGGGWSKNSFENGIIRFGWNNIDISFIINNEWEEIKKIIEDDFFNRDKKTGATNDFNALKNICEADSTTIFITFDSGKLFWCSPIENSISTDDISKYIKTANGWSCKDIYDNRLFESTQISGRITKYQLYMGTTCKIGDRLRELDYLKNLINGIESEEYTKLFEAKENLKKSLIPAIKNLTPKDFEIFTDLIFRNLGWRRTSVVGEIMKFFDLILEEPLNNKLHGVQIKSQSTFREYKSYRDDFTENYSDTFETLIFVVHSCDSILDMYKEDDSKIKLLKIDDLTGLAIDAGLIRWLLEKTK